MPPDVTSMSRRRLQRQLKVSHKAWKQAAANLTSAYLRQARAAVGEALEAAGQERPKVH